MGITDLTARIVRIDGATLTGRRPRTVGCNSQKGRHGNTLTDPIVRLTTDSGVVGWGSCTANPDMARLLAGKRVDAVFDTAAGTAAGYDLFDLPLWDLAGRLAGVPVHALLGGRGDRLAPVYDGSIYMEDLDPDRGTDRGLGPLEEAVQMGLAAGFEAFKMKIGRGAKWMERKAGFRRDVEAITRVREIIGPDRRLLVDGNNGFTPKEAAELVKAARSCSLYWFEEPFPEEIAASRAFREVLNADHPAILLADGEGTRPWQPEIRAILRARAIDVVQFDLRPCPITAWLTILPLLGEAGVLAAPHNWASHLLNYCIPHFGRALTNFCMGETDMSVVPEVDSTLYRMSRGKLEIPDAPGFGLELDHRAVDGLVRQNGWSVTE